MDSAFSKKITIYLIVNYGNKFWYVNRVTLLTQTLYDNNDQKWAIWRSQSGKAERFQVNMLEMPVHATKNEHQIKHEEHHTE